MIFLYILACAPNTDFSTYEWVEEQMGNQFFQDELTTPKGFVSHEDGFLVAEAEEGVLSIVTTDTKTIVVEDMNAPNEITEAEEDSYLISTATEILEWNSDSNISTTRIENRISPHALTYVEGAIYWIEEGAIYTEDDGTIQRICESLSEPYDIIYWAEALWFSTQGDRSIWKFEEDSCTHIITLDDIPHRFTKSDEGLWLTTRSFRWPYGGWILAFDGERVEKVSESPPEPEHIITWQNTTIWSSKQSITAYTNEPYDILSIQTTAANLLVVDDVLYWTDTQGGRIGMHSLQQ